MIGHYSRHFGPRFDRGTWSGPRFFRGYRRPAFFYARPGYHRFSGRWQQPTAEQQALRSTAAEVARLFVIAARAALYKTLVEHSSTSVFSWPTAQRLSHIMLGAFRF